MFTDNKFLVHVDKGKLFSIFISNIAVVFNVMTYYSAEEDVSCVRGWAVESWNLQSEVMSVHSFRLLH